MLNLNRLEVVAIKADCLAPRLVSTRDALVAFPLKRSVCYSNCSPLTVVAPMVVMGKSSTRGAMMSLGHTSEASTGMTVCAPISVVIRKVKLKLCVCVCVFENFQRIYVGTCISES